MTDETPSPNLDDVAEAIKQAHQAEDELHDMAPFQTTLDDEDRPNTFAPPEPTDVAE